jgi:4-amino-4-deoxy-L-arabinose transferase-like glycosyltransferase
VILRTAWLERPGAALLLVSLALIVTAGAMGLIEPTETRYAEVAREMRASGDYLIPRLNDIPHFHKPALAYWAVAAGFAVAGENEWGARLPSTLAAIATLALVPVLARRRFGALAIPPGVAAWALGSSLFFFVLGRSVATDPYLALSVTAFWTFAPSPWALAALGLGFFAKGPVAFVPTVLVVLVAALWGRDKGTLRLLGPGWGWLLFALVALPWYLIVVLRVPGLLDYFLGNQIWERYATRVHHRGGPPWYFVGVLVAGALPWTPALLAGIARLARERARIEAKLLLAWLVVPLVFFSFSGSKLPSYLLPCLPAVALIAGAGLRVGGRVVRWTTAGLLVAIALAGWILGPAALGRAMGLPPTAGSVALPLPAHLALACLLYAATWFARGKAAEGALLALFAWTSLFVAAARFEGPLGSPRPLARLIAENRRAAEPLVEYARFNAGVPFYLKERARLLEVPRETAFDDPALHPEIFVTRDSLRWMVTRGRVWILGPVRQTRALADSLGLDLTPTAYWRRDMLGFLSAERRRRDPDAH